MADPTPSPREAGVISRLLAKAWPSLSAEDRRDLVADAAAASGAALAKAAHEMETMDPNDHGPFHMVEDQWNGPPDDALDTTRAHGPGMKVSGGEVPIGPRQAASGDGAIRMERMYSRLAPQYGVEEATNRLGRALAKSMAISKALYSAMETMSQRLHTLETSTALTPAAPAADLDAAIAKAIAAATPSILRQSATVISKSLLIAKAEEEEEEEDGKDEEEEEEEEVAKAEHAEPTKIEIDNEIEDEEGDEDKEGEKEKEAAKSRIVAKSLLKLGQRSLRKAKKMAEDGKDEEAGEEATRAKYRMGKARIHLEVAKAIRGKSGPSTCAIEKALKAAAKEMRMKPQAKNQTNWPEAAKPAVGKSDATAAVAAAPGLPTAEQIEEIRKAVEGVAMLQTNMQGVIDVLARQPAATDNGLPPMYRVLAKAKPAELNTIEAKINDLARDNVITLDQAEQASDVIGRVRRKIPGAEVLVEGLAEPIRAVVNSALAA